MEDIFEVYEAVDGEESTGSAGLIATPDLDDCGGGFCQTEVDMTATTTFSMLALEDEKLLRDERNRLTQENRELRNTGQYRNDFRVFEKQWRQPTIFYWTDELFDTSHTVQLCDGTLAQ